MSKEKMREEMHPARVVTEDDFYHHLLENTPALVSCDVSEWGLSKLLYSSSGAFSMQSFSSLFGEKKIAVHTAGGVEKESMRIDDFVSRISCGEGLYAKDWHFFQMKHSEGLYETPHPFSDDWLNAYWLRYKESSDDYRFLYIGGPFTKTFVHHDVLYSYSWSVNLHGRKKWTLWPLQQTKLLQAKGPTGVLDGVFVVDPRDGHYDEELFPGVSSTVPVTVIQDEGEALFVPSGWYHMVENVGSNDNSCDNKITVSVNHNWINGFNIYRAWRFISIELNRVFQEMKEFLGDNEDDIVGSCKGIDTSMMNSRQGLGMEMNEWLQHCEFTLQVNCGMGIKNFFEMLVSRVHSLCKVHFNTNGRSQPELLRLNNFIPIVDKEVFDETVDTREYQKLKSHHVQKLPPSSDQVNPHHCVFLKEYFDQWTTVEVMNRASLNLPLSLFDYCMVEVLRIFYGIQNNGKFLAYLRVVYGIPNGSFTCQEAIENIILLVELSLKN